MDCLPSCPSANASHTEGMSSPGLRSGIKQLGSGFGGGRVMKGLQLQRRKGHSQNLLPDQSRTGRQPAWEEGHTFSERRCG